MQVGKLVYFKSSLQTEKRQGTNIQTAELCSFMFFKHTYLVLLMKHHIFELRNQACSLRSLSPCQLSESLLKAAASYPCMTLVPM